MSFQRTCASLAVRRHFMFFNVLARHAAVALFALQVPNTLSICGAVLICSCTFLLGVFTRKKAPTVTTDSDSAETDPAAAEREEIESLLGHKPASNGIEQNGRTDIV